LLTLPEKLLFALLAVVSLYFAVVGFRRVILAVSRGERGYYPSFNHLTERCGEAIARTISQSTVFRDRPLVSFFHALVFYGFIFYALVNLFDLLEAYLPPAWLHGFHQSVLGGLYRLGADLFTALVIVGVGYFFVRRFLLRDPRLLSVNPRTLSHEDALMGLRRDSLIVLGFIFLHVGFRLLGHSSLLAYQGQADPWQPVASLLAGLIGPGDNRIIGWHIGFWGALGLILAFLPYFPRSKHLHLFMAPANFALEPRHQDGSKVSSGVLSPINFEDESVERYGVERLEHFRLPQLLDAYACIMCNRCTNACPAAATGKALSPAAIEINKRYELNRVAGALAAGGESPRAVLDFVINQESLWACTTCGACIEICPVGCEQMIDIIDIRRQQVLMAGAFPSELGTAFRGLERAGNPWGLAQDKRDAWAAGLGVPTVAENPNFEVLFFVGCAGSYDPQAQQTTRAMAEILNHAGVNYAILGKAEKCTGDPARRSGNEYLYYQLASENVATLNDALQTLDPAKPKRVLTTCPHCFNALANDYPQLGGHYTVMHHSQLIDELMLTGRLPPLELTQPLTYHDPCYLGRHNGIYDAPRDVLTQGGNTIVELPRHRENSFCCGAGGAQFWKEEEPGAQRVSENRFQEAQATGAAVIATGCPFCKVMLASSESAQQDGAPEVVDIAQLVAARLRTIRLRIGTTR